MCVRYQGSILGADGLVILVPNYLATIGWYWVKYSMFCTYDKYNVLSKLCGISSFYNHHVSCIQDSYNFLAFQNNWIHFPNFISCVWESSPTSGLVNEK